MEYTVYILQSQTSGKTYVGQTFDLKRRLAQHNDPECRFTLHTKRHKGPWVVIHTETFATRSEAMRREKVSIHNHGLPQPQKITSGCHGQALQGLPVLDMGVTGNSLLNMFSKHGQSRRRRIARGTQTNKRLPKIFICLEKSRIANVYRRSKKNPKTSWFL